MDSYRSQDYSDFTCQDCCHTFRVTRSLREKFPKVLCPECSSDNLQEHEASHESEIPEAREGVATPVATPGTAGPSSGSDLCSECGTNLAARAKERERRRKYMAEKRAKK